MTKSELFKKAHEMARTFVGNYRARFALALKLIREGKREMTITAEELNVKFNVNVKRWEKEIKEIMEDLGGDEFDATVEASQGFKFKKDFIFVSFRTASKKDAIKCIGNSYIIKEELKELGFKYNEAPQTGWNLILD